MALGKTYTKEINPGILDEDERFKRILITDIPVIISDAGEIVCIPRENEVFSAAICGSSIEAKSEMYYKCDGKVKYGTIEEIYKKFKENKEIQILTINKKYRTGKIIWAKVKNVWNHGKKELLKIKTGGKEINVTKDHSLFSAKYINSYSKLIAVEAKDLKNVVTIENLPIDEITDNKEYPDKFLILLGLWIADGCYDHKYKDKHRSVNIAFDDTKKLEIVDFLKEFCNEQKIKYYIQEKNSEHGASFRMQSTDLTEKMKTLGFNGKAKTKRVPNWIKELSNRQLSLFLKGYFSGDGSYHKSCNTKIIDCSSISYELLQDLQILLNRFGIMSRIDYGGNKKENKLKTGKIIKGNYPCYKLRIGRKVSIDKYLEKIGFIYKIKYETNRGWCKDNEISIFKNLSIEKNGEGIVYDLEVPGTECFVANGFLCHNSGMGKTMLGNFLVSQLYHSMGYNVAILNDLSEETYAWSEAMQNFKFQQYTEWWINQSPCPSPLVYIYPHTNTIMIPLNKLIHKNYLKIILPFTEILDDLEFYLKGVLSDFELGKSGNYINDIKEELAQCETPEQIKDVLDEHLPGGGEGKRSGFEAMRAKIFNAFSNLMKEEILDITNPECHAYLKIKEPSEYIGNPFSVIMKAKGIPSLITSDIVNKKYKSVLFSHYINQIFNNHLKDFPGEKTFLYFDELRTVCEKDDEPASKAVGNVSARGRINNVGLIYATQFYDKIPNSVKGAKLNYCFAFRHNNSKILNELSSDFDLDKAHKEKIKNLKTFECLALTNKTFVCYLDGDRYEVNKPIRGHIIYPIANHLKPTSEK